MTTANNEFIGECLEFDALIAKLAALRADHFNVDTDAVNWGDVGSVKYVNDTLRSILAHYTTKGI